MRKGMKMSIKKRQNRNYNYIYYIKEVRAIESKMSKLWKNN